MGCHVSNKQKNKIKEDPNKKQIDTKLYTNTDPNETRKNTIITNIKNLNKNEEKNLDFQRLSQLTIIDDIKKYYIFEINIGSGSYGLVRKGKNKNLSTKISAKEITTGKYFAIKTVWKELFEDSVSSEKQTEIKYLKNEIEIILNLDHENIIKCYKVFEDKNNIHFVFEYINGGDLFSLLSNSNNKYLSDIKSLEIFLQILESIQYIHSKNIIHRDIKPENFLIFEVNGKPRIKLIDFGFSVLLKNPNEKFYDSVGSLPYISPEMILSKGYDYKTDIFSVGVVLYNIITGEQPFYGNDSDEIIDNICNFKQTYPEHVIDRRIIDFVDNLLEKNPEKRISADQAIIHKWITDYKDLHQSQTVSKTFEPKLENYKNMLELIEITKLKNLIWNILLTELDIQNANKIKYYLIESQISQYYNNEVLHSIQGKYNINYYKFLEVMIEKISGESELVFKLKEILIKKKKICEDNNLNFVDLLDFLINSKNMIVKEKVWNIFRHNIETNNMEYITIKEIIDLLIDKKLFQDILDKRAYKLTTELKYDQFESLREEYEREILKKNKSF